MRNIKFKNKIYLFLPLICVAFWIFLSLIKDNIYIYDAADFNAFFSASRKIYLNPGEVYSKDIGYFYFPSFAMVFGLFTIFLSYNVSSWIFFIILSFFSIYLIIETDKLLKKAGIDKVFTRVLVLLVIANSYSIMLDLDALQPKVISAFCLILFLRREVDFKNNPQNYNENKFMFSQMMILIFGLGLIPQYFLFFSIIYLFHKVSWKQILSKKQIKKYGLFILALLVQNFMIIIIILINPKVITVFFNRSSSLEALNPILETMTPSKIVENAYNIHDSVFALILVLINELIDLTFLNGLILLIFSMGILLVVSFLLASHKDMDIGIKFGYFSLIVIFFSIFFRNIEKIIFITLTTLLFIISLTKTQNIVEFLKKNFYWLLGLFSLQIINLIPREYYFYKVFPFLLDIPIIFLLFGLISIHLILGFSILIFRKQISPRKAIKSPVKS